ncbi:MAG: hypothetical protein E7040_09595 [Lentisphaerae bacterium]|nr:hypothetical protein [Lentisphaerota bacterium]
MKKHFLLPLLAVIAALCPLHGKNDDHKFAKGEDGILLHASFSNYIQADKANGSQTARSKGEINFVNDGVRGQGIRLKPGDSVSWEQNHNINLNKGTVTFWMRPVDWDPAKPTKLYNWIFRIAGVNAEGGRIQIFKMPSPNFMAFVGNKGRMKEIVQKMNGWKKNQWYFIALSWNETRVSLFINGKLAANAANRKEDLPRNTGTDMVLQSSCGTTDYDELKIFDNALSAGDIEALYIQGLPKSTDDTVYRPVATVGKAAKAPVIDGSAADWKNACRIGGFLDIPQLELSDFPSNVRISYDDKALYFFFETKLEKGSFTKPAVVDLKHLWSVPTAEFLFQAGSDPKLPVYQLAFNMFGQQMNFTNTVPAKWKAQISTRILADKWIAEIAIPYSQLNIKAPQKNSTWHFNFGRNIKTPDKFCNPALSLAYGDVSCFWKLIFSDKPADTFDAVLNSQDKKLQFSRLTVGAEAAEVSLYLKKTTMELKSLNSKLAKPRGLSGVVLCDKKVPVSQVKELKLDDPGRYLAVVEVKDRKGNVTFRQLYHFKLYDTFHIRQQFFSKQKKMEVHWELNQRVSKNFKIRISVLNSKKQLVKEIVSSHKINETSGKAVFDMSNWKELDYSVKAVLSVDGVEEVRELPFKCFYNAEWHGFEKKLNLGNSVMPPWVPIKMQDHELKTLTQSYTIGATGFPVKVSAIGKEMLASPVKLSFATGKSVFKPVSPVRFIQKKDHCVSWEVTYRAADCRAVLTGQLEYDGMIRYDLQLFPDNDKVQLSSMIFTMPFDRKMCKYMLPYAGPYQKWTTLETPTDIVKHYADAFMPHLWAGDDFSGIAWFAESDEFYLPLSREKVVEMTDNGINVEMKVNMVQKKLSVSKGLTYTFGIQATPAKQMEKNWTSTHLASCVPTNRLPHFTMGYTTGAEYHKYSGIPLPTKNDDRARRYVESIQRIPNRHALIYITSNGMGSSSPEFQFYEEEWKNPNSCDTWTLAGRGEYHWGTNPHSQSLRDYYLYTCLKTVEKFNNNGFYYDYGTVMGIHNPAGGVGYVRDGKPYQVWPIFSDRAMRKAIYEIVYRKRGKAVFVLHNYSKIIAPITSFSSMILDGEPYQQKTGVIGTKVSSDYTELIPLSRFRTMFGVQFGTIPYFLAKFPLNYSPEELKKATRTIVAMAMPHGVQIWGFYCDIKELTNITHFQDGFNISEAEFVSLFYNRGEITAAPAVKDKHLLSYWKKSGGEYLVILSNLTDQPYRGEIRFKSAVPGKVMIQGEDGEAVFNGKTLNVSIPAKDFRLYRIIPGKK